jgi:hypothetical protein
MQKQLAPLVWLSMAAVNISIDDLSHGAAGYLHIIRTDSLDIVHLCTCHDPDATLGILGKSRTSAGHPLIYEYDPSSRLTHHFLHVESLDSIYWCQR